jgi:hypothetical protein
MDQNPSMAMVYTYITFLISSIDCLNRSKAISWAKHNHATRLWKHLSKGYSQYSTSLGFPFENIKRPKEGVGPYNNVANPS